MVCLNNGQIDMYVSKYEVVDASLYRAARFLRAYVDMIDANSDGWAYWKLSHGPVATLQEMLVSPESFTEKRFKQVITGVKRFCTRKKLPFPVGWDETQTCNCTWKLVTTGPLSEGVRRYIGDLIRQGFNEGEFLVEDETQSEADG